MSREELLLHGYIRQNVESSSPQQLLHAMSLWLSLTDSWDPRHTDTHIEIDNACIKDEDGSIDNRREIERNCGWDTGLYHAFGTDIISRGQRKVWNVQITKKDPLRLKPYIMIGIMPYKSKLHSTTRRIEGFVQHRGYCMYTASGKKYHDTISGYPFAYGQSNHNFKVGDVISMQLDLTRKMKMSTRDAAMVDHHRCGTLKFVINGQEEQDERVHVAFDDIDIDRQWVFSIGLYFQDAVRLLKC